MRERIEGERKTIEGSVENTKKVVKRTAKKENEWLRKKKILMKIKERFRKR